MKIIGLTGGSGAGKTRVAACFAALGAGTVDADAVYRALCASCRPMLDEIGAAFGDVLDGTGALDRPKLAKAVFSDPEKLKKLSEITFPYIRAASEARFAALADEGRRVILYDAPTLYQTGADAMCDAAIGVVAPRETRVARIMARDGISREAACARIDSQPDESFYRRRCDFIIENGEDAEPLELQACEIWNALQPGESAAPAAEPVSAPPAPPAAKPARPVLWYALSFGSALAIGLSLLRSRSVLLAIVHGLLGWLYVLYCLLFGA